MSECEPLRERLVEVAAEERLSVRQGSKYRGLQQRLAKQERMIENERQVLSKIVAELAPQSLDGRRYVRAVRREVGEIAGHVESMAVASREADLLREELRAFRETHHLPPLVPPQDAEPDEERMWDEIRVIPSQLLLAQLLFGTDPRKPVPIGPPSGTVAQAVRGPSTTLAIEAVGGEGPCWHIIVPKGTLSKPAMAPGEAIAHMALAIAFRLCPYVWAPQRWGAGILGRPLPLAISIPDIGFEEVFGWKRLLRLVTYRIKQEQGRARAMQMLLARERRLTHGADDALYLKIRDSSMASETFARLGLDHATIKAIGERKRSLDPAKVEAVMASAALRDGLLVGLTELPPPTLTTDGAPRTDARSTVLAELVVQVLLEGGKLTHCERCRRLCPSPGLGRKHLRRERLCGTCRGHDERDGASARKREERERKKATSKRKSAKG